VIRDEDASRGGEDGHLFLDPPVERGELPPVRRGAGSELLLPGGVKPAEGGLDRARPLRDE